MKQRAHEAITALVQSKDFKQCISKIEPRELQDDLAAEVSLILLETDPEKIVRLADAHQLKFYAARVVMNLAFSTTSPFYRKYRRPVMEFKENYLHGTGDNLLDDTNAQAVKHLQSLQVAITDDAVHELALRQEREDFEERVLEVIEELYWYDCEMVKLYMKLGNYRQIEAETGIPHVSCFKTVKKAFAQIKQRLDQ
jgi:hypothetical protein